MEQSTNCCSERETRDPVLILLAPSIDPVAEKAQHEPHDPWFLTPVTAPDFLQSTESGRLLVEKTLRDLSEPAVLVDFL